VDDMDDMHTSESQGREQGLFSLGGSRRHLPQDYSRAGFIRQWREDSGAHFTLGASLLKARVLAGVLARRSDREDAVGERVAPKLKYAQYPAN